MTDLVAFLMARLADDQRIAEEATQGSWEVSGDPLPADAPGRTPWNGSADVWVPNEVDDNGRQVAVTAHPDGGGGGCFFHGPDAVHAARHDPSRVLAEVAAKRAILAEHEPRQEDPFAVPCVEDGIEWGVTLLCTACAGRKPVWPCTTVRLLVQPFRDHPDFDPAWTEAWRRAGYSREEC